MTAPTTRPLKDYEGEIYRNSGTYASPTLVRMRNMRSVDTPDKKTEDDVTARRSNGFKWTSSAGRELELNFQMLNVKGDADITALRTAYEAGTPIEFFVMDYDLSDTSARGSRAFYEIFEFTTKSEDKKSQYIDVKCKPTWAAQAPEPVVGGSSWSSALGS